MANLEAVGESVTVAIGSPPLVKTTAHTAELAGESLCGHSGHFSAEFGFLV